MDWFNAVDATYRTDLRELVPRYTAEEVRRFPDDRLRYEVIRGDLIVTPAPGTAHQRAVLELARRHVYFCFGFATDLRHRYSPG